MSMYGSRLPSPLLSEGRGQVDGGGHVNPQASAARSRTSGPGRPPRGEHRPWRMSHLGYQLICLAVKQTAPVQAGFFEMPSRHALNRYIEGYFSGFHEHLPFLHLPTTHMPSLAPELILAIAAVGAKYRFQGQQGQKLSECARAVIAWRLEEMARPPPSSVEEQQQADASIQLLQAMVLIMALGTWNQASELSKSAQLGVQIALFIRELGLLEPAPTAVSHEPTWEAWIRLESSRRTKLVAYCFLNLQCIAYDWPTHIAAGSIDLRLPCSETLWRADGPDAWSELYTAIAPDERIVSFKQAYSHLFGQDQGGAEATTAQPLRLSYFGNYIMAHAILQQVFHARQAALPCAPDSSLPDDALARLECALGRWQKNWESTEDPSIDPSSPSGPLSFNSTALFRLAHVRMHADLGPHRHLETRDPSRIAVGLKDVPHLRRSGQVFEAVLQCVHALSIPVRIGVEFVSRMQAPLWSIVHCLCNFECAAFLGQWLGCVATRTDNGDLVEEHELRLVNLVQGVLRETDNGVEVDAERDLARRCRLMAAAVARVCSQTLRGTHVWEIMDVIGSALEMRAAMF